VICGAVLSVGVLMADVTQARPPKSPRAASTPSTAQILAQSAATVPDALPPDKTVYRCGNAYSARACTDAASKPIAVADARSDAQRRQSEQLTVRDQRMAAWLEAERREREGAASAPKPARVANPMHACEETAAITCKPKKPRPRHAVGKTTSGAVAAKAN
jgi:hypothetical protein